MEIFTLFLGAWNGTITSRDFAVPIEFHTKEECIAEFNRMCSFWASLGYRPYCCRIDCPNGETIYLN